MVDPPVPIIRRRVQGFEIMEFCIEGPLDLTEHAHSRASLSLLLQGGYRILGRREPLEFSAPMVVFFPSRVRRRVRFRRGASHFLWIELPDEPTHRWAGLARSPQGLVPLTGGRPDWLAQRLLRELRSDDDASDLLLHGLVLELLGRLVRAVTTREATPPAWLTTALRAIHDHPGRASLRAVARKCGLHPTHFSRAFKRLMGCTPSDYSRQTRVARAQQLLLSSELSLAEISVECGFADQAHLTREFQRLVGTTPRRFRGGTPR